MTTNASKTSSSKTKAKPVVKKTPAVKTTTARQPAEKPITPKVEKAVVAKAVAIKKPLSAASKSQPAAVKTLPKQPKEVAVKAKKSKLIRDSFTIPDHEYKLIQTLKERSINNGIALKKSELIRAGILKLIALNDTEFKKAISAVDIIKTGRPTKAK